MRRERLRCGPKVRRGLENRVQYWRDGHAHHLPKDPDEQHWLAQRSGFADWRALEVQLQKWRTIAAESFDQLFGEEEKAKTTGSKAGLLVT